MAAEYIPPLRFAVLTRFYDRVVRVTMRDDEFKRTLVSQADLRPGYTVVDLGCGTATLTILAKRACPDARIVGIDPDAPTLELARANAMSAGVDVELVRATADTAPVPEGSVDRVLSSLMFHHLDPEAKRRTLRRVLALLRPAGEIHIADWGRARSRRARAAFLTVQMLDGFKTTAENVHHGLSPVLEECGFVGVAETQAFDTLLGTVTLYRAAKPEVPSRC